MKIGLIDVDGHNFPNIPLMKLAAYHKTKGDHVEFYRPLITGHCDKVYMSKVFSFSPDYDWCIDADEIYRGGSGYCIELVDGKEHYNADKEKPLPDEIEHIMPDYELYGITDTAYGFLTRGCPRKCGFCHVGTKEGLTARKVADVNEFWQGQKNIVLCDPNILASKDHLDLLEQLSETEARVEFNQGLDIRLITDRNLKALRSVRLMNIHFAYDRIQDKDIIEPRLEAFVKTTGFNRNKGNMIVYILCNYDTTIEDDLHRIQFCRELNVSPFPMIYDKEHCDPIYRKLQRWCNNNIFWTCTTFEEYNRSKGEL